MVSLATGSRRVGSGSVGSAEDAACVCSRLRGVFKHFLFSPLPAEIIQFD